MPIFKFGENNAIVAQLPFLTAELVCSEDRQYANIDATLPLLEGSLLFQASIVATFQPLVGYVIQQQNASINAFIPFLTADVVVYQEVNAEISAKIPFINALIFETNRIAASLPPLSANVFVSRQNYATISATIPFVSASLNIFENQYADIIVNIPAISANIFISEVNISAEINAAIPNIIGTFIVGGGYSVNTIGEDCILKFEERRRYI